MDKKQTRKQDNSTPQSQKSVEQFECEHHDITSKRRLLNIKYIPLHTNSIQVTRENVDQIDFNQILESYSMQKPFFVGMEYIDFEKDESKQFHWVDFSNKAIPLVTDGDLKQLVREHLKVFERSKVLNCQRLKKSTRDKSLKERLHPDLKAHYQEGYHSGMSHGEERKLQNSKTTVHSPTNSNGTNKGLEVPVSANKSRAKRQSLLAMKRGSNTHLRKTTQSGDSPELGEKYPQTKKMRLAQLFQSSVPVIKPFDQKDNNVHPIYKKYINKNNLELKEQNKQIKRKGDIMFYIQDYINHQLQSNKVSKEYGQVIENPRLSQSFSNFTSDNNKYNRVPGQQQSFKNINDYFEIEDMVRLQRKKSCCCSLCYSKKPKWLHKVNMKIQRTYLGRKDIFEMKGKMRRSIIKFQNVNSFVKQSTKKLLTVLPSREKLINRSPKAGNKSPTNKSQRQPLIEIKALDAEPKSPQKLRDEKIEKYEDYGVTSGEAEIKQKELLVASPDPQVGFGQKLNDSQSKKKRNSIEMMVIDSSRRRMSKRQSQSINVSPNQKLIKSETSPVIDQKGRVQFEDSTGKSSNQDMQRLRLLNNLYPAQQMFRQISKKSSSDAYQLMNQENTSSNQDNLSPQQHQLLGSPSQFNSEKLFFNPRFKRTMTIQRKGGSQQLSLLHSCDVSTSHNEDKLKQSQDKKSKILSKTLFTKDISKFQTNQDKRLDLYLQQQNQYIKTESMVQKKQDIRAMKSGLMLLNKLQNRQDMLTQLRSALSTASSGKSKGMHRRTKTAVGSLNSGAVLNTYNQSQVSSPVVQKSEKLQFTNGILLKQKPNTTALFHKRTATTNQSVLQAYQNAITSQNNHRHLNKKCSNGHLVSQTPNLSLKQLFQVNCNHIRRPSDLPTSLNQRLMTASTNSILQRPIIHNRNASDYGSLVGKESSISSKIIDIINE